MISKVAFIGSKSLGLSVLKRIFEINPESIKVVVTLDDQNDERSNLAGFESYCKKIKTTLKVIKKSSQLISIVSQYKPQMCLVVGWYWIIKNELLNMVPEGWLGVHASLLPLYRGGAPLVWSIINGESTSGVSLFYFDEGMDSGDIVAQIEFPISKMDTIMEVLEKATTSSLKLINENYQKLLLGKAPRKPQSNSQATYYPMRSPADGYINWFWNNEKIYDFIRAQTHPYPGAFCWLPNKKMLRIWKAEIIAEKKTGRPGTIVRIENSHLYVLCGEGTVIKILKWDVDGLNDILKIGIRKMIKLI